MFKNIKIILVLFVLITLLISCQQSLIKKEIKSAEVDSTFYFKPIEVKDPFLEKLKENTKQSFTMNKKIVPPFSEKVKPAFKMIDGFRVQIFAGVDSVNALASRNLAKNMINDTMYQFIEKGLIKIQVGDFPYYPQADSIKRIFRQSHFPGAWIVKTKINIPNVNEQQESDLQSQEKTIKTGKFKIQIIATGDRTKAQNIANDLKMQFSGKAYFEESGNVFKVFVGNFEDEQEARKILGIIKQEQYPDAWLVY